MGVQYELSHIQSMQEEVLAMNRLRKEWMKKREEEANWRAEMLVEKEKLERKQQELETEHVRENKKPEVIEVKQHESKEEKEKFEKFIQVTMGGEFHFRLSRSHWV